MKVRELRNIIDIVIIAVRPDEFEALQKHFPTVDRVSSLHEYHVSRVNRNDQQQCVVALVKSLEGPLAALSLMKDVVSELRPDLTLTVGIGGAVPQTDGRLTLGDVVISSGLLDVTRKELLPPERAATKPRPIPLHERARKLVENLDIGLEWSDSKRIDVPRPSVEIPGTLNQGCPQDWGERAQASQRQAANRNTPLCHKGTIASGPDFVKDPEAVREWEKKVKRYRDDRVLSDALLATEMESIGVHQGSIENDRHFNWLSIRGISDIIGLDRDRAWNSYACASSAAFTFAFVRSLRFEPRETREKQPAAEPIAAPKGVSPSRADSLPTTSKRGAAFNKLVAAIQTCIHGKDAKVESPCFLRDPALSPGQDLCEFDIVVTVRVGDSPIRIGFEAHEKAEPLDVPVIRQFSQKAKACGIHRPVIVSSSGFTKAAIELALFHHIDLRTLKQATVDPLSLMTWRRFRYRALHILVEKDRESAWRSTFDPSCADPGVFLFPQAGRRSAMDFVKYFLQLHALLCSEHLLGGLHPKEGRLREPFQIHVNSETFLFKFRSKLTRATAYSELAAIVEYDIEIDRAALRQFIYDDPATGKSIGELLEWQAASQEPQTEYLFSHPWVTQAEMVVFHIPAWKAKKIPSLHELKKFYDDLPIGKDDKYIWLEIPCNLQTIL